MGLLQKIFGGGSGGAKAAAPARMVEDYLRSLKGKPSLLTEAEELPHAKPDILAALRDGMKRAVEREDWVEFDRLRDGLLRIADFQDTKACAMRGQAPETAMIAEVRMLMSEVEAMLGGLQELNGMWSGDKTHA